MWERGGVWRNGVCGREGEEVWRNGVCWREEGEEDWCGRERGGGCGRGRV